MTAPQFDGGVSENQDQAEGWDAVRTELLARIAEEDVDLLARLADS